MQPTRKTLVLVHQGADEILGENHGEARDIEDELFRIQRGELSARFGQRVDNLRRHLPHACIEQREQACRAAADDRNVAWLVVHS